jgi:enolase
MPDTKIRAVHGRRVWDSRGMPTVEVEVHLADGTSGRAIAPTGVSVGKAEAPRTLDGGARFGGQGVQVALARLQEFVAPALAGVDAANQQAVDEVLLLKGAAASVGASGMIAVSLAAAHATANSRGLPLFRHLAELALDSATPCLPLPEIQVFGGGAHAPGTMAIQEILLVCPGAGSYSEALEWSAEVYRLVRASLDERGWLRGVADQGGFWPAFREPEVGLEMLTQAIRRAGLRVGVDAGIALDLAATEFHCDGRYEVDESRRLSSRQMIDLITSWVRTFPVLALEDPLAEDDFDAIASLTAEIGSQVQITGDDIFATSVERLRNGATKGLCNCVLIKPAQQGTLTQSLETLQAARDLGYQAVMSGRSGETEDVSIMHLAVGWGVPQIKLGGFSRSERMAKWNEGLRIEESIGKYARFGADALSRYAVRPR